MSLLPGLPHIAAGHHLYLPYVRPLFALLCICRIQNIPWRSLPTVCIVRLLKLDVACRGSGGGGFNPRAAHVRFMVNEVALGLVYIRVALVSPVSLIQMFFLTRVFFTDG
jgi:hypothetical protein